MLPHVPPELFEEVLLLAQELLLVHLAAEAELVAGLEVADSVPPVDVGQCRSGNLLYMRPLLLDHLAPLLQCKIFLLTQGVESRNPALLHIGEPALVPGAVAAVDPVDDLAVVLLVLLDDPHRCLIENIHLPGDPLNRADNFVDGAEHAIAVENNLLPLSNTQYLPADLGHRLLALRLDALGQFIADPLDGEHPVVDGAVHDSSRR